MYGWNVQHIKPHSSDAGQKPDYVLKVSMASSLDRRRPWKELVPGAEVCFTVLDPDGKFMFVDRRVANKGVLVYQVAERLGQHFFLCPRVLFRVVHHRYKFWRTGIISCSLVQQGGAFKQFHRAIHSGSSLLFEPVVPGVEVIDPCLDCKPVLPGFCCCENSGPPVVYLVDHLNDAPF